MVQKVGQILFQTRLEFDGAQRGRTTDVEQVGQPVADGESFTIRATPSVRSCISRCPDVLRKICFWKVMAMLWVKIPARASPS